MSHAASTERREPPRAGALAHARLSADRVTAALPGALACALVTGAAFAHGGYFPGSWGWLIVACAWTAGLALVLSPSLAPSRRTLAAIGAWTALVAWIALSGAWTDDATQTALEGQRALVYLSALAAGALVVGQRPIGLVRGLWAAATIVAGWGLLTRLLPERLGVYDSTSANRLAEPVGYWNSLGLAAAIGLLLALGIAARERGLLRAVAVSSAVPLALTLYFTFSRGAWAALAVGLLAALAIERRRLHLLATAAALVAWPAVAVALASRSTPLTSRDATLAEMSSDGHRLLVAAAALAVAAGLTGFAFGLLERRVRLPERARRGIAIGIAAAATGGAVALFAATAAPWTLAERGWRQFDAAPPAALQGPDLNERLFSLSSNGRMPAWRVAWSETEAHPLLGSGAGTYERAWNRERTDSLKIRDAHNLYVEALSELGPLGLVLLVGALAVPFTAIRRARSAPYVAVAAGAYAAFVVHLGADWHWEVVSVTLLALLCGLALLAAAGGRPVPVAGRRTTLALAAAAVLAGAGVYVVAQQVALSRVSAAAERGDWSGAERAASRASRLAPWSSEPWQRLGEAQLDARRYVEAREAIRRALAEDPGDWALWFDLARASDGATRAEALDRALALNPLSPEALAYRKQLQSLSAIDGAR